MNPGGRLAAALFVALVTVAGGVALEEVVGTAEPPALAPSDARSDAWFCPHGGAEGWRAWVVLANPSDRPATVSVTTHGVERPTSERSTLEAGRQRFVPVPAGPAATGTTVESFGAAVAAGMVVARPQGAGVAAEPCARRTGTTWYVPDGSTVRGQNARVVVMNPTGSDAVVDVALVKDDEVVEPGRFEGVVLSPGEVASLDIAKVALGERTVAAVVSASLGEVVAAGLGSSSEAIRSILGVPATARRAVLQGSVDAAEGEIVVMAPAGDVPLAATAVGQDGPKPLLEDAGVEDGTAERFGVEGGDVTTVVDARGTGAFVAGRRLRARTGGGGKGSPQPPPAPTSDEAATAGAVDGATTWIVPSPLTPEGGRSLLSLHNTGTRPARVAVSLLTAEGARRPDDLSDIGVPPGRTVIVGLTEAARDAPVTALVEASAGEVVAAQTGVSEQGYAVVTGVPWESGSSR